MASEEKDKRRKFTESDLEKAGFTKDAKGNWQPNTKRHVRRFGGGSKARLFAKGRLKPGEMNRTEKAYADHLDTQKFTNEIAWWRFEGIKLKLANNTTITIDFAIMLPNGELQFHDVKGARAIYQDDAKVKMKVAADQYPFRFFVVFPKTQKQGGGWDIEEVNP